MPMSAIRFIAAPAISAVGSLNLDAARVGDPQHQVGGPDPDMQGTGKATPAQQPDAFPDAQSKRSKAMAQVCRGMQGENGPGFPGTQRVESMGVRRFHHARSSDGGIREQLSLST